MTSTISLPLLERARIAAPCPAKWDEMVGDDKVRHCARCNLDVHNFSAFSREEAESLLAQHFNPDGSPTAAGRICGGFYRRADGTFLLQDCPTGLAAVRKKVRNAWLRIAAAVGLLGSSAAVLKSNEREPRDHWQAVQHIDGVVMIDPPIAVVTIKQHQPFRSAWAFLRPGRPTPLPGTPPPPPILPPMPSSDTSAAMPSALPGRVIDAGLLEARP